MSPCKLCTVYAAAAVAYAAALRRCASLQSERFGSSCHSDLVDHQARTSQAEKDATLASHELNAARRAFNSHHDAMLCVARDD